MPAMAPAYFQASRWLRGYLAPPTYGGGEPAAIRHWTRYSPGNLAMGCCFVTLIGRLPG